MRISLTQSNANVDVSVADCRDESLRKRFDVVPRRFVPGNAEFALHRPDGGRGMPVNPVVD